MDDAAEERIEQLEADIKELKAEQTDDSEEESGVSRRDVLAGAGAGSVAALLGIGGLNQSTQTASASSAPNYGTPSNPADFYAVDVFGPNGEITMQDPTAINDLTDATSGATVYDTSAEELTATVNNDLVNTESLNGAEQVSQHSSIQAAIDAAGTDGTVVFDPAGGPYTFSSEPTLYDRLTIVLQADCEGDFGGSFFNLSGHSGITIVGNGHTLDGLDRTGTTTEGVDSDGATTDCHIQGVLTVKRVIGQGVNLQGTDMSADTIIGINNGDPANNASAGDAVNIGSVAAAEGVHVGIVIGTGNARHTLTFGSNTPTDCHVDAVISDSPGGAHVAMEEGDDCTVGSVFGKRGRAAGTDFTSPQQNYNGYAVIALLSSGTGTDQCLIEYAKVEGSLGSGADVEFGNNTDNNEIGVLVSRNSPGNGVTFGAGADEVEQNTIRKPIITGAGGFGVRFANASTSNVLGSDGGLIANCSQEGVLSSGGENEIGAVTVRNNVQGTAAVAAAGILQDTDGQMTVRGAVIEDTQDTATQTIGLQTDDAAAHIKAWDVDVSGSPTPYSFADAASAVNGTVQLSAAPSGSDYDVNDAGLEILDTSTSPTDVYYVRHDGAVDGPI